MKPREDQHVFASSPRRITEDPGGEGGGEEGVVPNLLARLSPGSPSLQLSDSVLEYQGPLPKFRHCASPHKLVKEAGTASFQNSAAAVLMGSQLWKSCSLDWVCDALPTALQDGV